VLTALFYANFRNSVERLNSPVYSAPRCRYGVAWWRNIRHSTRDSEVAGSSPDLALSGNNLGQVVHTSASVTKQSRSGDALRLGR